VARFQCTLVKAAKKSKHHQKHKPAFRTCKSPKTYRHLKTGHYTFEVRGVNSAGPAKALAHKKFKI
jgi:hypothetical protein